jgi:Zn-dependent protease/predicted transcriptional regulator
MKMSIQVGRIIGIPIRLHVTFLIILPLIIFAFAENPATQYRVPLGLGDVTMPLPLRYFLASIATFIFFFTLLLHEASHSYVAMRYGTKIRSITLFIFGGVAMMEDIPREPKKEWRIAIAGPTMSFAIAALFLIPYYLLKISNMVFYRPIYTLMFVLGFFNLILAGFNLLPAFPMDGGRILRSFLARKGAFIKATKRAALIGKIFAVVMGVVCLFRDPFIFVLTGEWHGNIWTTLLAIFLYIGASEEEKATVTYAALEGIKVKQIMRPESEVMRASMDMPLTELVEWMLSEKTLEYVVANENGEIVGFITYAQVKDLSLDERLRLTVRDVISSSGSFIVTISGEKEAIEALKRMLKYKRTILVVEGEERGNFEGIITKRDLITYMEILKDGI